MSFNLGTGVDTIGGALAILGGATVVDVVAVAWEAEPPRGVAECLNFANSAAGEGERDHKEKTDARSLLRTLVTVDFAASSNN